MKFKEGSTIEIISGKHNATSAPHPYVVHEDEIELMDKDTFDEVMKNVKQ